MRRLVLIALFALVATQTTGCVITAGDDTGDDVPPDETGLITANWSFKDIATNQILGCPSGFNTAAVTAQPVDGAGNPQGSPIIDLYTCSNLTGTADYPLGRYQVFVEITTGSGGTLYAQSLSAIVDITSNDQTFTTTILDDGGYFIFDWTLRGAVSNSTLSCTQAGNPDSIEIISTLTGTTQGVVDKFNCEAGTGVTGGLLGGAYVVSIDAEKGGAAIGIAPSRNETIRDRNQVTDLGAVTIPIDGL